jgi:hypothetical protein
MGQNRHQPLRDSAIAVLSARWPDAPSRLSHRKRTETAANTSGSELFEPFAGPWPSADGADRVRWSARNPAARIDLA